MTVLEIKLRSSGRGASALTTEPPLHPLILYFNLSLFYFECILIVFKAYRPLKVIPVCTNSAQW